MEDKINWFTHNYKEEISAFLTGEIKNNEIIIDGLLFPHQNVTSGSVEVEPKNLVKLRKEYGDECLRIIGHWHSHNTMGAFWSTTDDTFIDEYSKTKDISIFLVSSTIGKCRIMLIINKPFEIRLDNISYETIWDSEFFEEDLKQIIEDKVTETVIQSRYNDDEWEDAPRYNENKFDDYETRQKKIKKRIKKMIKFNIETKELTVKNLNQEQADTLEINTMNHNPEIKRLAPEDFNVVYKIKNVKKIKDLIDDIKIFLEDIIQEELRINDFEKDGNWWE